MSSNTTITVDVGGLGVNSLTAYGILIGAGISPVSVLAPDSNANKVLTGGGSSAPPAWNLLTPSNINSANLTGTGNFVLSSGATLLNPIVGTQTQGDGSTKAASTAYVDLAVSNAVAGINPVSAVDAATTAASSTSSLTYDNGSSGVGATLTGSVNTAFVVDGFTFTTVGQRLLVKNDTQAPSGSRNGIYSLTQLQDASNPPIFTRSSDFNTPSEINSSGAIPIVNGTVNATTFWVNSVHISTIGTDSILITQFTRNPNSYITTSLSSANFYLGNSSNVATAVTMSGDVTMDNTGATVIGANKVGLTQLAQISTATFLGRTSSGTGNVQALTATQLTAALNTMVGDSGAGGTKGLVPAPAAGDSAAGKFLKANGTWTTTGTVTSVGVSVPSFLSVSGSPVTTSGTIAISLSGTALPITSGGTGQITANAALNALLPTQAANTVLTSNGTNTSFATIVDANISSSAAIAFSKLAPLASTKILVGNGSNVATAVTMGGDGILSNAGTLTILGNVITLAKMAQISTQTFLGRTTAGTGNVENLTATQATAILNSFVGDSGSGGTKGLVPAPASGDAAASKYLKADGTWSAISGTGTVTSASVVSANGFAGTVATATTTPAITLTTTINAPVLAGNGTAISAATTTGTGSTVVLSASPTISGTVNLSGLTASKAVVTDASSNLSTIGYGNTNTVSTLVQRDSSGNFSAGTITASLTGTASLATAPASGTARGAVTLDGSGNFTSVAPGTSGNILQSNGTDWVSAASSGALPVGSLQLVATNKGTSVVPSSWLPCDGRVVAQSSYPSLYSQIGILDPPGSSPVWTAGQQMSISNNDVCFGNSLFVEVGNAGAINTSGDGLTFTAATSGTASALNGVCYSSSLGLFVAVGAGGVIRTSTTGTGTWTSQTSGVTSAINGVRWLNNTYFIAGVSGGAILKSTNGTSWSTVSPSGAGSVTFGRAAYGNSTYAIIGSGTAATTIYTSTDTVTWTASPNMPYVCIKTSLDYGNGVFVAGSVGGAVLTSTDALTWKTRQVILNTNNSTLGPSLVTNGQYFLAVSQQNGNCNSVLYSQDGIVWTGAGLPSFTGNAAAVSPAGTWVVVGNAGKIATSTNLTTWTAQTSNTTSNLNSIAYGNGRFVAIGNTGAVTYSTNEGSTWTSQSIGGAGNNFTICYMEVLGVFVVGGNSNFYSTNGITWTAWSTVNLATPYCGAYVVGVNELVIGNTASGIAISHGPASTFTAVTPAGLNSSVSIVSFAAGNGVFIGRCQNQIFWSVDSTTWNVVKLPTGPSNIMMTQGIGYDNNAVIFDQYRGVFIAFGQGCMYTSRDGANWTYNDDGLSPLDITTVTWSGYSFLLGNWSQWTGSTLDGLSVRWNTMEGIQPNFGSSNICGFAYGASKVLAGMSTGQKVQTQLYDPTVNFKLPNQNQYDAPHAMLDTNNNFKAQWYIKAQ